MGGQSVSDYDILRKIGEGDRGEVGFVAVIPLKLSTATETPPASFQADDVAFRRSFREAEVARRTKPSIQKINEILQQLHRQDDTAAAPG